MTREEAINGWVKPAIKNTWNEKKCGEIIEALGQEPCEDAISRQAVLDIIDSDWKYEGMEQYINELPPVNPQPKTGHWINAKVGRMFPSNDFKCSECGNILNFDGVNGGRGHADYCPNCGCRMVEPQESED